MNDKKPLVAHGEYGKDEDGTQALIKKHEAIELDIEGYSSRYYCTLSKCTLESILEG